MHWNALATNQGVAGSNSAGARQVVKMHKDLRRCAFLSCREAFLPTEPIWRSSGAGVAELAVEQNARERSRSDSRAERTKQQTCSARERLSSNRRLGKYCLSRALSWDR